MSSEAQLAANRANAQHSCGPITPEGKAAVSQNRTIHGLNSNPETFRVLPCESQADYDQLLADLLEDEEPANTVEKLLVLGMAQHRWLADRAVLCLAHASKGSGVYRRTACCLPFPDETNSPPEPPPERSARPSSSI